MQKVYIKFQNLEQVIRFVNVVNRLDVDFDLGSKQRVVNAKSVLGIFTLDLSEPLLLQYHSKCNSIYDLKDTLILEKIAPFLLTEEQIETEKIKEKTDGSENYFFGY